MNAAANEFLRMLLIQCEHDLEHLYLYSKQQVFFCIFSVFQ